MATINEKLADSLTQLQGLQNSGKNVFRSNELSRVHRERLITAGYLQLIIKGWLMSSKPGDQPGDSTAWYASRRDFIRGYCEERFGENWCV